MFLIVKNTNKAQVCPKFLALGQFETEISAERQMDGIKSAKDRGIQFGKRPALTRE